MQRIAWTLLIAALLSCALSVRIATAQVVAPREDPAIGSSVDRLPTLVAPSASGDVERAIAPAAESISTPPEPQLAFGSFEAAGFSDHGMYLFHGYSGWRGIAEGSGGNNNGFNYGANFGTRLGALSDATGIGLQLGSSYGLYDLNGRSSGFHDNQIQQQTFVTAGLFRKAGPATNFSGGVVADVMINDNLGQFAVAPLLTQLRAQIAYAVDDGNELGFWTALRTSGETLQVGGPLSYRGVDQFNLFWHHKFGFGGDGVTWIGLPDNSKLGENGSLGSYIFGGTLTAPLSPRWAAYTDLQYMAPSAPLGAAAANQETFFIGIGLIFYPGENSRTMSVVDNSWMPYLPVGNNGSFLVDTNRTF